MATTSLLARAEPQQPACWSDPSPVVYATGSSDRGCWRMTGNAIREHVDELVEEVAVALVYGGAEPFITMATPLDVEDLARGFAITEGIVDRPDQIVSVDAIPANGGMAVFIELAAELRARTRARRRVSPTTGACGICGMESASEILKKPARLAPGGTFSGAAVFRSFDALPMLQQIGQRTGGAHAAAFADADGRILAFAEDVGRHNALDKLVGRMARLSIDPTRGFCAVTSRASFEMVQKAIVARMPMLCAISAPTGLAVRLATECDLTLCAFVRDRRLTCFSAPIRLEAQP